MSAPVRTRVAPSPTGDPHVGTAYVALFNRCFAHGQGGQFVLRIEDTDRQRSTLRSEQQIMDSLRWLGLDWDEGPDVGGPHGPYRQSERGDIYASHVQQLLDGGHAFHCFCTPERLSALRAQQMAARTQPGYDGHCLRLADSEVRRRLAAGEPSVVRLNVPREGSVRFADLLRGEIEIPWTQVDMQVLIKQDGMPTYHLAAVVDDHLMGITHVLRGEEWINSVPKHTRLYECFGWQPPVMCHLPLLRNPDKSKLSKRRNPTSINYYRDAGFLPETMVNFLGMMGFSMPDGREQFTVEELQAALTLERITLGSPVFDQDKLAWLNGQWLRSLAPAEFERRVDEWLRRDGRLSALTPLVRERVTRLDQLVPMVDYLLGDRPALTAADLVHKSLAEEEVRALLQFVLWALEAQSEDWTAPALQQRLSSLAERMELKIRDFLAPLFVAISGKSVSLPLFDSMAFLGPDLTRARVRDALEVLGGVGKKQQKKLEKRWQALAAAPETIDSPAAGH